ncbi:MAG: hypothetical protein AAGH38_05590, partial [Pseudomonadota bacterium]
KRACCPGRISASREDERPCADGGVVEGPRGGLTSPSVKQKLFKISGDDRFRLAPHLRAECFAE